MRLRTSLIALACCCAPTAFASQTGASFAPPAREAATPRPDDAPPPSDGPQGTSQRKPGEERYDRVGQAGDAGDGAGVFALSNLLPPGSHAEVTALDTGKTILVVIRGEGSGLADLSRDAASQLGVTGAAAVRIRKVTAPPQDARLLAAGKAASPRADAPPVLLAGLKRQLGEPKPSPQPASTLPRQPAPATASTPAVPKTAPAAVRTDRGLFVQIAALSNAQRAKALADQLGGMVRGGGGLHRVQTGPYPDAAAARRARADLARRGYGDARIVTVP
jgi:rare lipoprotein A